MAASATTAPQEVLIENYIPSGYFSGFDFGRRLLSFHWDWDTFIEKT